MIVNVVITSLYLQYDNRLKVTYLNSSRKTPKANILIEQIYENFYLVCFHFARMWRRGWRAADTVKVSLGVNSTASSEL